jgi:hypothetical protein
MTTKAELAALEKVFAREIKGNLPFQSKAKIFAKLAEKGMIEPMVREFRGDRFGSCRVEGWLIVSFRSADLLHVMRW